MQQVPDTRKRGGSFNNNPNNNNNVKHLGFGLLGDKLVKNALLDEPSRKYGLDKSEVDAL